MDQSTEQPPPVAHASTPAEHLPAPEKKAAPNGKSNIHLSDEEREQQIAEHWVKNVYQGDHVPQLTVRSIITGMLLGGVMSLSNLYVGLKTGWGLGVSITACILAFAIFSSLRKEI